MANYLIMPYAKNNQDSTPGSPTLGPTWDSLLEQNVARFFQRTATLIFHFEAQAVEYHVWHQPLTVRELQAANERKDNRPTTPWVQTGHSITLRTKILSMKLPRVISVPQRAVTAVTAVTAASAVTASTRGNDHADLRACDIGVVSVGSGQGKIPFVLFILHSLAARHIVLAELWRV
ncbi:hypothetical protein PoB_002548500 [Plakobranchus ocellatus]|uniref:Uncharacterized protein n=1 Tax=Plakobranchus ocellatus TaxID=259542 RepID=A0AAV3ZWH8_9GAST|nr:hypothetical protein PoB_002548500 [Plakobranchus ocellatus]